MNWPESIDAWRRWIVVVGLSIGTSVTLGTLAAIAARLAFDFTERSALIFVGIPAAILILALLAPKLAQRIGLRQ